MNIPLSDPLPLPAPPLLLQGLLLLTFALHVLAMNIVLGGSIIAAVTRFRKGEASKQLAETAGKWMPTIVAAAVTFGVAPLLFLQTLYGRLFFSSAVLMAWFWLAIVPVLMLAYYGTYAIAFHRAGAVIASIVAVLFIVISFIQSNNMTLMLRPDRFLAMYFADGRGLHLNLVDATFLPRWLHMLFGAIAVAGAAIAVFGAARKDEWSMRYGARWFIVPTLFNIVTGMWWLGALPREVLLRFMGRSVFGTVSLGLGIALGFASIVMLFIAGTSEHPRKLVIGAGWTTLATLVAMIFTRDEVRRGMFELAQFRGTTWIEPQWGVIAIFVVLLVAALGTSVWMASLLRVKSV